MYVVPLDLLELLPTSVSGNPVAYLSVDVSRCLLIDAVTCPLVYAVAGLPVVSVVLIVLHSVSISVDVVLLLLSSDSESDLLFSFVSIGMFQFVTISGLQQSAEYACPRHAYGFAWLNSSYC